MARVQYHQMTLGVEEEFQLLCPETLKLVPGFDHLASCWHTAAGTKRESDTSMTPGPVGHRVLTSSSGLKSELHQSCCELVTEPCLTVTELDCELRSNRHRLAKVAESAGMVIGLSGTHPFSLWYDLPITREPRRLNSEHMFQEAHRQCLAFALHIHVGIPDRPTGLRAMNDALVLIPILYALSCSSPFLEGRRTGLKSSRVLRAFGFPRTGIPDKFDSVAELDAQIAAMQDAGLINDAGQLWWDVRLHHALPTIEFRIADAVPQVQDVVALAAFTQAFVAYLLEAYKRGSYITSVPRWILSENRWRAARFGTEAELIVTSPLLQEATAGQQGVPSSTHAPRQIGSGTVKLQSIPSIVEEVCDVLMPVAAELGTTDYLEECQRIAQTGSAADRQLSLSGASNSELQQVVRQYCQETLAF